MNDKLLNVFTSKSPTDNRLHDYPILLVKNIRSVFSEIVFSGRMFLHELKFS